METIEQALQMMENGRDEEALEMLRRMALSASPEEKYKIIEIYNHWGFLEEGILLLEDLLQQFPNEGELIIPLAEMHIELKNDETAIDLLNKIKQDDPLYTEVLLLLADVYQAQGLFEVTEQKLLEAKKLMPNELVIDFALGEFLFSIGQTSRAIPFYEKVYDKSSEFNHISIEERLAECHALLGHYDEALEYFNMLDSENPDILFKYGFTAARIKRFDIAIRVWSKLLELDPYYHTAYYELAKALKEEGRIEEAYEYIQKGLKQDEFNKELYVLAAQLAVQLHKEKDAFTYLQEAITLDYEYQDAVMMLINLYKEKESSKEIIELVSLIKEMGADNPLYNWELARAYEDVEQYKDALLAFESAAAHLQHDSEFLKEYGYFLSEEGRFKEASDVLTNYMKLEPLDEDVQAFVGRLNDSNNE